MSVISISAIDFYNFTVDDLEKACTENSSKGATSFYLQGLSEFPDYMFAVSKNGDDEGQELFVFRMKKFGTIKRFYLERHTYSFMEPIMTSYVFRETEGNSFSDVSYYIFYSSNPKHAVRMEYVTSYNENGNYVKTQITNYLLPNESFITVSNPLKSTEVIESLKLFDENSNVVYEY